MSAESSSGTSAYVTLARVLRPRGNKGEVACEILTDFPERLPALREVFLTGEKDPPRRIAVRSCWLSPSRGGQAVFHFEGCATIAEAETLRGFEVQVPLSERVALLAGRYYVTDLIGCEVFARGGEALEHLGTVRDVEFTGEETSGTALLVVETRQGELLVPLAEEICPLIDVAARRIEIVPLEGLRELNRS